MLRRKRLLALACGALLMTAGATFYVWRTLSVERASGWALFYVNPPLARPPARPPEPATPQNERARRQSYRGYLAGQPRFHARLDFRGSEVRGRHFFGKLPDDVKLEGHVDEGGHIELVAKNVRGSVTGTFNGMTRGDGSIRGNWVAHGSRGTGTPFEMRPLHPVGPGEPAILIERELRERLPVNAPPEEPEVVDPELVAQAAYPQYTWKIPDDAWTARDCDVRVRFLEVFGLGSAENEDELNHQLASCFDESLRARRCESPEVDHVGYTVGANRDGVLNIRIECLNYVPLREIGWVRHTHSHVTRRRSLLVAVPSGDLVPNEEIWDASADEAVRARADSTFWDRCKGDLDREFCSAMHDLVLGAMEPGRGGWVVRPDGVEFNGDGSGQYDTMFDTFSVRLAWAAVEPLLAPDSPLRVLGQRRDTRRSR
jgi:hypothetical protein